MIQFPTFKVWEIRTLEAQKTHNSRKSKIKLTNENEKNRFSLILIKNIKIYVNINSKISS